MLKTLGMWYTVINLQGLRLTWEFLVAKDATQDALIGTNLLKKYQATVSFTDSSCSLLGRHFPLSALDSHVEVHEVVEKNLMVLPRREVSE